MANDLEGKIQAPMVVFAEKIEYGGSGFGGVQLVRREGSSVEGCGGFGYQGVEAVYDAEGNPKWQNWNSKEHRKAEVPEHLNGTQVVFTPNVVYEGANMGGHHFSFLKNGEYVGHDHQKNLALDFGYGAIKAIFDRDGKSVWENWNYKPQEAQPKE